MLTTNRIYVSGLHRYFDRDFDNLSGLDFNNKEAQAW